MNNTQKAIATDYIQNQPASQDDVSTDVQLEMVSRRIARWEEKTNKVAILAISDKKDANNRFISFNIKSKKYLIITNK